MSKGLGMKPVLTSFTLLIVCISVFRCSAPRQESKHFNVHEVEAFMTRYADMLRVRNMEGVANLYDSVVIRIVYGKYKILSLDSVRAYYLRTSREPVNFRWDKINIEPLADNSVLVTAVFYWNGAGPATYTGVLVKRAETWKIKHEHESFPCDKI